MAAQISNPMPPGFVLYPGGMVDSSPAFQRWVARQEYASPEGTVEGSRKRVSRPFGTNPGSVVVPNVETLGYCRKSLRDKAPRAFSPLQILVRLDFQSAVSQNCILRAWKTSAPRRFRSPADYKSAIQQIENLRYVTELASACNSA